MLSAKESLNFTIYNQEVKSSNYLGVVNIIILII